MQFFSPVRALKTLHFAHEFCLKSFMQNRKRLKTIQTFPTEITAKLPGKPHQLQMSIKSI